MKIKWIKIFDVISIHDKYKDPIYWSLVVAFALGVVIGIFIGRMMVFAQMKGLLQ